MLTWRWTFFDQLTTAQLYRLLRLRQQVFVIEQNCPYLDADGLDPQAWHLLGCDPQAGLVAYLRVLPPGLVCSETAIGRVITDPAWRGRGLGQELFARGVSLAGRQFPGRPIRISAQQRLERFYCRAGFRAVGEPYLEDGIPHIAMLLTQG